MSREPPAAVRFDFRGMTAVVTGASSGIGAATAQRFAGAGARLVLVSRRAASDLAAELAVDAADVRVVAADVGSEAGVQEVASASEALGGADVLVHSAAAIAQGGLLDIDPGEWDEMMRVNVKGVFLLSQALAPGMIRRKWGRIVVVSSIAARNRSRWSGLHYTTSKSALLGFTRQLGAELAPHGVRVNAVCPGTTRTPMMNQMLDDEGERALAATIPAGRVAEPAEIADVIAFLCSDGASYAIGSIVDVNGGQL